ncbi:rod-binding protein [Geoalkalibacter halelectricus]|uniref:Rod-binding protein n=1 Tax=Geoalkalibacter halelectricus TaxID=2847045 RepID=A0ABY5ZKS4_9BACT|nr:rod-binding protein [Geoalkalibacter halelectricus]MDO3378050.1 rod-binding protein [Geoalkalibacter halelectricus]UWZ78349.1 rod-binding protein [Geoalkalibacter halelectricus]
MNTNIDPRLLLAPSLPQTADPAVKRKDPEKLRAACQDFEALFVHAMFKEMRKTIPQDGLLPRGMAEDSFQEMMDWELARQTSRSGSLGIAEALYRQLGGEEPPK